MLYNKQLTGWANAQSPPPTTKVLFTLPSDLSLSLLIIQGVLFCFALEDRDTYIEKDWRGSLSLQSISPLSVWVYGMEILRDVKTGIKNVFVNSCMGVVPCAVLSPCLNQVYILALAVLSQKVILLIWQRSISASQSPHSLLLCVLSVVSPWTLSLISFLLLLWENNPCLWSKLASLYLALCPYDKMPRKDQLEENRFLLVTVWVVVVTYNSLVVTWMCSWQTSWQGGHREGGLFTLSWKAQR